MDPSAPNQGISTGPAPQVSFDDYVAMSGAVAALGYQGMLAYYKLSPAHWTQIAGHWNAVIPQSPQSPQYVQYGMLVEQEAARIRSGGAPRPVTFGAGAQPYAAANPWGTPHQQQEFNRQAQDFGAQVGNAFAAFGNALGSFAESAVTGFAVGARVLVQWSDGNRYPGTVTANQSGQVQITFPDGRAVWVPQQYVSLH